MTDSKKASVRRGAEKVLAGDGSATGEAKLKAASAVGLDVMVVTPDNADAVLAGVELRSVALRRMGLAAKPRTPHPDAVGKDAGGRFAKGNKLGPSNAHRNTMRRYKEVFLSEITEADVRAVARSLVAEAKAGNMKAQEMFFNRIMGKEDESGVLDRMAEIEEALRAGATLGEAAAEELVDVVTDGARSDVRAR